MIFVDFEKVFILIFLGVIMSSEVDYVRELVERVCKKSKSVAEALPSCRIELARGLLDSGCLVGDREVGYYALQLKMVGDADGATRLVKAYNEIRRAAGFPEISGTEWASRDPASISFGCMSPRLGAGRGFRREGKKGRR